MASSTNSINQSKHTRKSTSKKTLINTYQKKTISQKKSKAYIESEARYSAIVEAFEGLIYISSKDYRIEFMNQHLIERTGYDAIGEYCYKALHNLDKVCPWCVNKEVFQGKTVRLEVQSPKDNHWFYIVNTPIYHTNGSLSKMAMIIDITKRKKDEEKILQSETLLKETQNIAHLGSWELDLTTNQLIWSDEVYRIFGIQPQVFAATYESFLECVHSDDRAAVDAAYADSLREGRETYEIEHRVVKKDTGEVRYVHEKCIHLKNSDNKIIRSIGMVHDITERKLAEAKLKDTTKMLESILDAIPDVLGVQDPHHGIIRYNQAGYQFLNMSYDDVKGKRCYELIGRTAPCDICATSECYQTKKPSKVEKYVDELNVWLDCRAYPILDENGSIKMVIEHLRDITEKVKMYQELKKREKELQIRVKELEEFYEMAVGRELRIAELKKQIEKMKRQHEKYGINEKDKLCQSSCKKCENKSHD
ncbi:MAG: PAS domain S-box protein [Nitrospirota bacterium]